MLLELRIVSQELKDLVQRNDTHHRDAEVALDLLNGRKRTVATLLAIQGNKHASRARALGCDDLHDFANRRACSDHVVDDQHLAGQRSTHQTAAFAMRLGFLSVETPRQIKVVMISQSHGRRGRQGNPLISGPEQHIEGNAAFDDRSGIELTQLGKCRSTVEQTGIEEVRTGASRLQSELTEAQNPAIDGKTNEIALIRLHEKSPEYHGFS